MSADFRKSLPSGMLPLLTLSECRYQVYHWFFPVVCVLATLFGYFIVQNLSAEKGVLLSGPYYLTKTLLTVAFVIPFIQAFFITRASTRDAQYRTQELVFTSGVGKADLLLSRYLAVVVTSTLIYCCFLAGIIGELYLNREPETSLIQLVANLAFSSLIFILPAMLLSSLVLFAAGLFSGSSLLVYLVAAIMFFIYALLKSVTGSPVMANPFILNETLKWLFDLLDPVAGAGFFEQVKFWTVAERNHQHISFTQALILNRTLVIGGVFTLMLAIFYRYQLRLSTEGKVRSWRTFFTGKKGKAAAESTMELSYTGISPNSTRQAWVTACWALCHREYMATLASKAFLLITLIWSVLLAGEVISGFRYLESLNVTPLPTTSVAINRFISDILPNFTALFLVFFSAEMAWRDKQLNISDLLQATPISNGQRFLAKWLALTFIPLTFISLAILISMLVEISYGSTPDIPLYLSLFYYLGLPFLCLATLCLFVHTLCTNKLIAMLITLAVVVLSQSSLGYYVGIEHGLFKFANTVKLQHSELIGFSAVSDAFNGYIRVWLSLSLVMAMLSFALRTRTNGQGLRQQAGIGRISQQIQALKQTLGKPGLALLLLASLSTVINAGYVYYQSNIIGHYASSEARSKWRAGYEKAYARYQDLPVPKVIATSTELALYPEQRRFALSASYQLQNQTREVISQVLISTHKDVGYSNLVLENATLTNHDAKYGQYLYTLETPLQPGDKIRFSFEAERSHNGYNGVLIDSFFTPDFIYFRDLRYMPFFGFTEHYTLKDDDEREEYDLAPLPREPQLEEAIAANQGDFSDDYFWARVETKISTSAQHVAVAPGELLSQSSKNNRNYFHYRTQEPIRKVSVIISAKLDKSSRQVEGTSLEVYHSPAHREIAREHLDAMAATLSYGNRHFSRYRAKQLRLFEVPSSLGYSGYAMPQMMLLDENLAFSVDRNNADAFDHLYRRTAHETAHQWWGHGLDSALEEGNLMLVETLAVYTQARLLEQKYGKEYLHTLQQYAHDRYLFGRGQSQLEEKPLYRAEENHLIYSKGTMAMNALQARLGADTVNRALQQVIKHHSYPDNPATSLDFIAALSKLAGKEHTGFINKWLKQVVIDDWVIESTRLRQTPDKRFELELCLSNQGYIEEGGAGQSAITEFESVDIGIFTQAPASFYHKAPDHRTLLKSSLKVNQQASCRRYLLNEKPAYVVLDPYYQSIDHRRENNIAGLELNEMH
ncbi:M1 family aminopeptidase [Thalassomonas sp. RHCl1]|uniref:M1 family aminopeptidase n=1 Tax=Thalassomonas sp. RHCl1 TaxID=2995320 RepID=UPI00248BA6A3|nr:M1 family aminopeptidase [Thalassomonas sp. RHCl1]